MNCKPGDLAFIIKCRQRPALAGHLVEVIEGAIAGMSITMPNGQTHEPAPGVGWWVCKLVFGPVMMDTDSGIQRLSAFLLAPDSCLKPIRDPGDDAIDEMVRPLPHEYLIAEIDREFGKTAWSTHE